MKGKPLMPFAIIAVIGIFLMVTMSLIGQGKRAEMYADGEEGAAEEIVEFDDPIAAGEELVTGSCLACHGQNLEGQVGPALTSLEGKLSVEEITNIVLKGKGGMPPIPVNEVEADAIAQYLLSISQ